MKRKIFRVEQKTGKLPDVVWKVVFEREIDLTSRDEVRLSSSLGNSVYGLCTCTDDVLNSLRFLFSGEQYRIILIVE